MKEITATKDIIKKYDTNDIVHFLNARYKKYLKQMDEGIANNNPGTIGAAWANMMFITNVLSELDDKLNGKSSVNVL